MSKKKMGTEALLKELRKAYKKIGKLEAENQDLADILDSLVSANRDLTACLECRNTLLDSAFAHIRELEEALDDEDGGGDADAEGARTCSCEHCDHCES